jgi:hypothetical protein
MNSSRQSMWNAVRVVVGASCLWTLSCAGAVPSVVTDALYPPSFHYIPAEKLKESMWRMASDVRALNDLTANLADADVPQQEAVRLLDDVASAAGDLSARGTATNHAQLDRNLPAFLHDVTAARDSAANAVPSYGGARSLISSCLACHQDKGARTSSPR